MRRVLCLALLAASAPLFAAEIPVAPPALVPVFRARYSAIATDGDDVLVVWSEIQRIRYGIAHAGAPADAPAKLLEFRDDPGMAGYYDLVPAAAFAGGRW